MKQTFSIKKKATNIYFERLASRDYQLNEKLIEKLNDELKSEFEFE
jgi:hypothetical protein